MQFNVEKMGEKRRRREKGWGKKWPKDLSFWSLKAEEVCIHPHIHLSFASVTDSQMSEIDIFYLLVVSLWIYH